MWSPRLLRALARVALLALLLPSARTVHAQGTSSSVPEPDRFLGFELGSDGRLLSYEDSIRYFEALAASSPRVEIETIGKTAFGRELRLVWIGAEPLLVQKERVLAMLRDVADPRRLDADREQEIAAECPNLLFMSMSMHSTEVGASLYAPVFAHELATREDPLAHGIRENVLVALLPCTNPDGMTMVAEWFERRKKADKPRAALPRLYQKWAGHDNNRDWFMLNLPETRAITKQLYERIRPTVLLDMHQMGNRGPRFFVPPYADPSNPNLDPILTQALNLLGTRMAHDMTVQGCKGVVTSTVFDNWWNGGNRNVPFRHNILGILTECASANLGDPVTTDPKTLRGRGIGLPRHRARTNHPDPWQGGTWNLREILRYDREAAWSVLRTMAAQREEYLRRKILLGRRAIARPQRDGQLGYRLRGFSGRDAAARRLVATLHALGVEVLREGEGAWIVPFAQPYRAMAKDLLEPQRYPELLDAPPPHGRVIRPYDASGWTLPLQFGVEAERLEGELPATEGSAPALSLEQWSSAAVRRYERTRESFARGHVQDLDGLRVLFHALGAGHGVWMSEDGELRCWKAAAPEKPAGWQQVRQLRLGVYRSHVASKDEGWTRYVLDDLGVPYRSVSSKDVARGSLGENFDVLWLPSIGRSTLLRGHGKARQLPEFSGGIGPLGLKALHDFVEKGGRLVAWGDAVDAALPIPDKNVTNVLHGLPGRGFLAPAAILRVFQEKTNDADRDALRDGTGSDVSRRRLTEGLSFDRPVRWGVLQRDKVAIAGTDLEALLTYPKDALLSGYLRGGKQIEMMAAYARVTRGRGEYLLMGFRPQNRGQTLATVPLLLRTALRVEK